MELRYLELSMEPLLHQHLQVSMDHLELAMELQLAST